MELSWMNAGLAAGTALAALPVILHLFMRQTPKKVVFPALRLIKERHKRSRKRLRVKNWLLLLARMALLALMALALARPSLVTEASLGDQEVPTALGLVFDTSLSMGYTERDKTRLDEAKEQAFEVLKKTPATSQVFIVDSFEPTRPAPLSPALARQRVEAMAIHAVNRPLNIAVGQAYAAVVESDRPRHEVYVLTDLARSAWDTDHPVEGLDAVAKLKTGVKTYVLRLTPHDYHDVAVSEASPASPVVTEGDPVDIKAKLRSLGPATEREVQLRIDGVIREKKLVPIPADSEVDVRFHVNKVSDTGKPHQGEVLVTGKTDPLGFDDVRYFTFSVRPPTRVLVVSDLPIDGEFVADAVEPPAASRDVPRPFRVDRIQTSQFPDKIDKLGKTYRCVFLNNVRELSEREWGALSGFVVDGGGLVVALGSRCDPENYRDTTAAQVLPAAPDREVDLKETGHFGAVSDYNHPLFEKYANALNQQLSGIPVFRYWKATPREGSRVLMSYTDKAPALVERVFKGSKTGRVLLWTTPLSRRPEADSPDAWNEFPDTIFGWSFYFLMNQSVAYLTGAGEEAWNFEAGRDVALPVDVTRRFKNFIVRDRAGKSLQRLNLAAGSDSLVVVAPQHLGHWEVNASGEGGASETYGFSVNAPEEETRFTPLEKANLDALFGGPKGYFLANSREQIQGVIMTARVGHELFPWLMFAILLVVTLENLLANRFYREAAPRTA